MKTVHVAAGIIRKEGSDELLAVQRGYGSMQGLWEFPGGKLLRGETPEDAVRRELMEELQVKVTNLRDFYTVEYDYPDFHLSMECYYCSLADESDEPQKHDRQLDIRWIPRTSLATVEWMPADKGLIDALNELKEDRLEASSADDAAPNTTDKPATKPKRAPKRRSKKRPKPGLLDGIDTSDLSADERELVRRRAAIKKSMKGNKRQHQARAARTSAPTGRGPYGLSFGMEGTRQARHRLPRPQDRHLRQRLLLAPLPQVQPKPAQAQR